MTAVILRFLHDTSKHSKLDLSPDELGLVSVIVILLLFVTRTFQSFFRTETVFVPSNDQDHPDVADKRNGSQNFALPDLSLSMPLRLKHASRQVFNKAIEPLLNSSINIASDKAQICLYLAALSEPAMLLLLAKRGCPVRPLGAVNVRNRFEIIDLISCKALLGGVDSAHDGVPMTSDLTILAKFPRSARRVRRGVEIDIEVTIIADRTDTTQVPIETIQSSTKRALFRQEFTMLQFMNFRDRRSVSKQAKSASQRQSKSNHNQDNAKILLSVSMPDSSPYAWAQLCKDYNPIHFSSILAKILGQPGQLAHGNHAVGVCLQTMSRFANSASQLGVDGTQEQEGLNAMKSMAHNLTGTASGNDTWWMEVQFRRPILLPAIFGPRLYDNNAGFEIVDSRTGKVTVEVSIASS